METMTIEHGIHSQAHSTGNDGRDLGSDYSPSYSRETTRMEGTFMRIYKKTMSFIAHICACSVVERRDDDEVTYQ